METATNRLLAPGDPALTGPNLNQRKMRYDPAGNLVNDSWTAAGSNTPGAIRCTYDAENRMTSAQDNAGGTTAYYYDGDGRRVRRVITNQPEVRQIYGIGGELLAEYPLVLVDPSGLIWVLRATAMERNGDGLRPKERWKKRFYRNDKLPRPES